MQLRLRFALLSILAVLIPLQVAPAEVGDETLRRKIADLRDDNIPGDCEDAMAFLAEHLAEKKVQSALLDEFNKTKDPQTKEECMVLLCHAPEFQPDEQFMRAVLKRMHHYGKPGMVSPSHEPAGNAGAQFLVTQIHHYPDLIVSELRENFSLQDLWVQYAVIRALAESGLLKSYEKRFSESYLKRLAGHLQSDEISGNAQTALNAFVYLGAIGQSALRKVPRASDLQGRQLALAILSYLAGGKTDEAEEKISEKLYNAGVQLKHFDSGFWPAAPSETGNSSEESKKTSVQSSGVPEFRADLMISYSYKAKAPLLWNRNPYGDEEGRDTITANERESLGKSHAANSSDASGQQIEGSSKLAPIRFSARVERKGRKPDAKLMISVEDSATGKALQDFPKMEDEEVLELLARESGHHVEVIFSPAQAKKIAEGLRAAIVRDEGEARDGLQVDGGFILIGR